MAYTDETSDVYLMGRFVPFDAGDKLTITRGEITDEKSENYYVAYAGDSRPIDLNVYDGVAVPAGKALTLFGAVCPIQNAAEDMTKIAGSSWTTGNRVTELEYIFAAGEKTWTERHEVLLTRMLAENWRGDSLYEFAHSFTFDASLAGQTVLASVQGYDAHGQPVLGTAESLEILVTAE